MGRKTTRDFVVLLLAGVLAAASARPSEARQQYEGDATSSVGDLRYNANAVAYRQSAREARAEFSIRVPYREIRFVPEADRFSGKLRITVEMFNASGHRAGYVQREAILQSTDVVATRDSLLGEVYSLGLTAPQGKYKYRVVVEDMNADRRGFVYKIKNQQRQGTVEGTVDMGAWLFQDPALSGIQFAWEIKERTEGSSFTKGPYEVMPHPSAYYGRFQDVVSAYYEIYDAPPPPEGKIRLVSCRIQGMTGDTLFTSLDSLRTTEGNAWPHALSVDVSRYAAGHYRMTLTLEDESHKPLATTTGEFDVLWSLDSWRADAVDFYEVTATALLPADSVLVFRQSSMGQKENWVERLWKDADPTPETGDNEKRDEFRRRVDYANAHYTIFERGEFSDRGRVYIRYGDPDDIKQERMPVGEDTLEHQLDSEIPSVSQQQITNTDSGVSDTRAYEIWTYDFQGRQLVPRFGMNEIANRMKFIFVDEQGYGEYTLKYSSNSGIH